jgi:hypothetical protein
MQRSFFSHSLRSQTYPSQLDEALHDATQADIQLIDADNGTVFSL